MTAAPARAAILAALSAVLFIGGLQRVASAQDSASRVTAIKAAFLYNMVKYIGWPADFDPDPKDALTIGVFGDSPIEPYLRKIARTKKVKNKRIEFRKITKAEDAADLNLLFIPSFVSDEAHREIAKVVAGTPTVVCGENMSKTSSYCVTFFIENNKVRFQIDLQKVELAQVNFSSKLLDLGRLVREGVPVHGSRQN